MERKSNYAIPSIGQYLFLIVFLFLSLSPAGGKLLADADTGYHIRAGEYILENHTIPKQDIFSYHSPPIPWTAHEWLSEVVMAVIHRTAGLTGIVIFFSFLLALTYSLLFRFLRANGRNILFDVLILLLVLVSSVIHWLARPHLFSLLIMVIWFHLLEEYQHGRGNRLILLPPIMLLWVNLHGGYLAGFILTGTYFLGNLVGCLRGTGEGREAICRNTKLLGLTVIACLIAALANPHGYKIFLFPFQLVTNRYIMDHIVEFWSPNFHQAMPYKYLLLLLVALLAISRNPLDFTAVVLTLLFLNMSLISVRYIPLFAIVTAPILSRQADALLEASEGVFASFLRRRAQRIASIETSARGAIWPAAGVLAVLGLAAFGTIEFRFDETIKPVAAVEFLKKEHIEGHMYDNDEFGDYLIYAAYPRYRVFFDGRSDMYGTERLKEFMRVSGFEPGWEEIVRKYDIRWFFIGSDSVLSRYLLERPGWKLIYSDNVANIHVKDTPEYRYLIDRYRDVTPVVRTDEEEGRN